MTYRFWRIDQLIRSGRYPNVPELACDLEVSRRTIERDVAYMRDLLGAPIEYDRTRRGYHYTEASFQVPSVELTEGELAALMVSARLLAGYEATGLAPVVRRALKRIMALLPNQVVVEPDDLERMIGFAPTPTAGDAREVALLFDRLTDAVSRRRSVEIRYYSASSKAESRRCIDPYTLYHARGVWYVIGYCHTRKDIRLFALHRILEARVTEMGFRIPEDYSPGSYMGHAWRAFRGEELDMVLRFSPEISSQVAERRWHATQQLEPQKDGSLQVHMRVAGQPEVVSWILSWGEMCEVLAPASLREAVARRVRRLATLYENVPESMAPSEHSFPTAFDGPAALH